MSAGHYAAVDLGASSGRVVVGQVGAGQLDLTEVHRFPNGPVALPDGLRWDILRIWQETATGLRHAARSTGLRSIGIDSWAIDHGLLDQDDALLGSPWHYRDDRTTGVAERLFADLPAEDVYRINGLQHLPFTTVYQLMASQGSAQYAAATSMLLVPDLLTFWLTGLKGCERTNASTTGMLDVSSGRWSSEILTAARISPGLLPPLREPGQTVGPVTARMREVTGMDADTVVTAVGSHDTASAVVAVPATGDRWAYVACGTWALVGVELDHPVLTEDSRRANFTNEVGIDGTIRYLRNVMGLWVLSETLRTWTMQGIPSDLASLLAEAESLRPGGPMINIDDPSLLPPGDMPARIEALLRASGQDVPTGRAAMVRCILESLAQAFARTVEDAASLSGRAVDAVHIVGGGANNGLLCQLTADACGRPVLAGPAEATALGNILVQARSHGDVKGDRDDLRELVRRTHEVARYEARG